MAKWLDRGARAPARLMRFDPAQWPPVPGECLGRFACRGEGYGAPCVPVPGEECGDRFYFRHVPPERAEAERRTDAVYRWRQARLAWLGKDHPAYAEERFGAGRRGGDPGRGEHPLGAVRS